MFLQTLSRVSSGLAAGGFLSASAGKQFRLKLSRVAGAVQKRFVRTARQSSFFGAPTIQLVLFPDLQNISIFLLIQSTIRRSARFPKLGKNCPGPYVIPGLYLPWESFFAD